MIVGTLFIKRLLEFSLSDKQKLLLVKLVSFNGTASQFVSSIKDVPKSTVWHNLRVLQKLGIVTFGNSHSIEINKHVRDALCEKAPVIGVVGGFGPETTAEFFTRLISLSRKLAKGRPKVVLANAAVPLDLEKEAISNNPRLLLPFAIDCIKKLNSANVDFIVIPCNTLHLFIDIFRELSDVPIISIVDEIISEFKEKSVKCAGLLATTSTINSNLFQNALAKENINTVIPNDTEQESILRAIKNVLRTGQTNKTDSKKLHMIISGLKKRGADVILLACTDLQLIIASDGSEIFDTMEILANSAVNSLNPAVAQWPERPAVAREVACSTQACGTKQTLINQKENNKTWTLKN